MEVKYVKPLLPIKAYLPRVEIPSFSESEDYILKSLVGRIFSKFA